MNLNIMINYLKKRTSYILFLSLLFPQESLYWEVADPIVNSEFIEAYINRLIEVDKFEENTIQASFSIIVQMDIADEEIELKKLKAKDYQMGQYISFDMSEIKKMDPLMVNMIMSREYKWKDVDRRDLSELEQFSTVDNVFKERSFKDARDAFWWSNSQISASSSMKFFIRQKNGSLAFRLEQGFNDLGLSRHLTENYLLGISNDIVSSYLIVPGNTSSVAKGIGHPLQGNLGFGFKFDTHKLGGQVNYMDLDGQDFDYEKLFSRKHLIFPSSSGMLYYSNTFQINRKVDTNYGTKIKDQKKEKSKSEKLINKSRLWDLNGKKYSALFVDLDENNNVTLRIDRDEKAHKSAEKGKKWTTASGSQVKAKLEKFDQNSITLIRSNDNFKVVLKLNELSGEDKSFIERLSWDGQKTKTIPITLLSKEDQSIIRSATGVVRARSGKGKELKVSMPFASMRLKAGLSFGQFIHANVDSNNVALVTDRVDAIGIYTKIEGVTDDKKSKAYFQLNASGSGFIAILFGAESNVYKMINLGLDFTLYPRNSFIDFKDKRYDSDSKWSWYPGLRPDEDGKGGGSLLISPYISVNF